MDIPSVHRASDGRPTAWPGHRLALEYDGRDHARADRRDRDLDRLDAPRREGQHVIVITKDQLARPWRVPEPVREALEARGRVAGTDPREAVPAEDRRWG